MDLGERDAWFVAILVMEPVVGTHPEAMVDLRYLLVQATGAAEAFRHALELGRAREHSYENEAGEICTWRFRGLKDLRRVLDDRLADGVEVYGTIEAGRAQDHVVEMSQLTDGTSAHEAAERPSANDRG